MTGHGFLRAFCGFGLLLGLYVTSWAADETQDSDADGLTDIEEVREYNTDPGLADTDTDGLDDGLEINEYFTHPRLPDSDNDGFLDGIEVRLGSDPLDPEDFPISDDLDGDGITNQKERQVYGSDPQRTDSDFDGLDDRLEIEKYFTDPTIVDSDGDGYWDGEEVEAGTDPADPLSK